MCLTSGRRNTITGSIREEGSLNYHHWSTDCSPQGEAYVLRTCAALYWHLKPQAWYFEALNLLRQLTITGGVLVLDEGATAHIYISILIMFGYLLLITFLQPYAERCDNIMQIGCTVSILIFFAAHLAALPTSLAALHETASRSGAAGRSGGQLRQPSMEETACCVGLVLSAISVLIFLVHTIMRQQRDAVVSIDILSRESQGRRSSPLPERKAESRRGSAESISSEAVVESVADRALVAPDDKKLLENGSSVQGRVSVHSQADTAEDWCVNQEQLPAGTHIMELGTTSPSMNQALSGRVSTAPMVRVSEQHRLRNAGRSSLSQGRASSSGDAGDRASSSARQLDQLPRLSPSIRASLSATQKMELQSADAHNALLGRRLSELQQREDATRQSVTERAHENDNARGHRSSTRRSSRQRDPMRRSVTDAV